MCYRPLNYKITLGIRTIRQLLLLPLEVQRLTLLQSLLLQQLVLLPVRHLRLLLSFSLLLKCLFRVIWTHWWRSRWLHRVDRRLVDGADEVHDIQLLFNIVLQFKALGNAGSVTQVQSEQRQ